MATVSAKMKVVFMGTPKFALPALAALLPSHEVIAVYTKPPKPAGRGQQEALSPIHQLALENGVMVRTPPSLRTIEAQRSLRALQPDVIVVVAYGLILPQEVLDIPKHGCINIHPSDLPRWRGAAPLHWTILSGDRQTAMCIMQMDAGMDTGDVLLRHKVDITEQTTVKILHDSMAELGALELLKALDLVSNRQARPVKQDEVGVTIARKLTAQDELLDFSKSARLVQAQVRAFSPSPGTYFRYQSETVKVIAADYEIIPGFDAKCGTVVDQHLSIACSDGVLKPTLLQRAGKKMIYTEAFLRGLPIPQGTILC